MKGLCRIVAMLLVNICGTISILAGETDSIRFSLLTCSPGTQIYELFGHTAIRYQNVKHGLDVVLNYGVFDFNTPNFVMRFVRGETDYQLGIIPYDYFEYEYSRRGSSVFQQELLLMPAEAYKLDSIFRNNYLPENRIYRYNYFYDNCTTRARDRIEEAVDGRVIYQESEVNMSFRDWVHKYTAGHPWAEFGIDLCLGSEADLPINSRLQMFIPFNLELAFRGASIEGDSEVVRRLVGKEEVLIPSGQRMIEYEFPLSPMQVALGILVLTLVICLFEWHYCRILWGWDIVLFSLQGITGCVIAFLFFFSVHPTVGSNYLLIIFNPIPLLYLPVMVYRVRKRCIDGYDVVNIVALTLFIAFWGIIPQKISLVIVPLALSLLVRSIIHLVVAYKQRGKQIKNK